MKALVKGLAIAAALLVAGQAQAATELTYVFQARGTGSTITGYDNQGPIMSAFSAATIRFVVSVEDGANVGFGFADSPIILSSDDQGLSFRFEPVRFGVSGGGRACFPGGGGGYGFVAMVGRSTDPLCSTVTINTADLGGLGSRFTGVITGFDVLAGRVGEDFAYIPMVPEPATWALTLLGFGLAGYALRRRGLRRRLSAAGQNRLGWTGPDSSSPAGVSADRVRPSSRIPPGTGSCASSRARPIARKCD